jgi:hypothetical protein
MEALHTAYEGALRQIADQIQNSETLQAYLEEEDETIYKSIQDEFEPTINAIYEQVAHENPLMLESLEKLLLDPSFEGLFLPKILGYAVLRGHVDQNMKYAVPQNHFKDILMAICASPNFEQIKKRIGQTTQIGFALGSDIWVTNLIDSIENKKIKTFLAGLKSDAFREVGKRKEAYHKYKNQFNLVNYHSAEFPTNQIQLITNYHSLKDFLLYRSHDGLDNDSLMPHLGAIINNKALRGGNEFLDLFIIIGLKFPLEGAMAVDYATAFEEIIANDTKAIVAFFDLYDTLLNNPSVTTVYPHNEVALSKLIGNANSAEVKLYFTTVGEIHSKGFVHPDAIEAVRSYYDVHQGLSQENECVRAIIMGYITRFLDSLEVEQYADFFEIYKIITSYIGIFSNERFNQAIKESSLNYVKRCFLVYTDKRSRDYQDIKKFISSTFIELGFLTDKQVVEMFKTKRKVD